MKLKVFITFRIQEEAFEKISSIADVRFYEGTAGTPRDILLKEIRDVEGLVSMPTDQIDLELFNAAPKLKVISQIAVGYDNIDVSEATTRRIVIGHTPDVLTESTADFTFCLLLATARRLIEGDHNVRNGEWQGWHPYYMLGLDIHNSTLGIVGLGRIGQAVARRAKGFNMRIIYYSRYRRPLSLESELGIEFMPELSELLSSADFITLHMPYSRHTHHLIGKNELALMKKQAILINTARGAIVDQHELYEALRLKTIWGAGLDVFEKEPIPANDPLLGLSNVVVAPHLGSASEHTRMKMSLLAAENLIAGLEGRIPYKCVNPEVASESKE